MSYLCDVSDYIEELKYNEMPNYNLILFQLEKCLLDKEIVPKKNYNWLAPPVDQDRLLIPNRVIIEREQNENIEEEIETIEIY